MALTCARCGAQTPDGNLYCQTCGTPLTAAGGVATAASPVPPPGAYAGPPAGIPPPVAAPGGYQRPYYTPQRGAPPRHPTPWVLILPAALAPTPLIAGACPPRPGFCPAQLSQPVGEQHPLQRRQRNQLDDVLHADQRLPLGAGRCVHVRRCQYQRKRLLRRDGADPARQPAGISQRGQARAARGALEACLSPVA